jgi:uncharacterized protein with FMN-binding domain
MRQFQSPLLSTLGKVARKLFLSGFVIFTFLIYAIHERLAGPGQAVANGLAAAPRLSPTAPAPAAALPSPTGAPLNADSAVTSQSSPAPARPESTTAPTAGPATQAPPSPTAAGQYKDGQYTGPRVNAFYGWVQVQAVIQNGEIADVKFLQYPSDRRTSQRINSYAMPYLTNEAIQAQSANVDIVSGATLTSDAFAQSLQSALQNAAP